MWRIGKLRQEVYNRFQGWPCLFSKELLCWKLYINILSVHYKEAPLLPSFSSPSFSFFFFCLSEIKVRTFKYRSNPLPPSQCEFYEEVFYSLDFLVCNFIGLHNRLLLSGEIKSSDFLLARSLSPSAVLPLGDGSVSGRSTLHWLLSLGSVLPFQGKLPVGSQTWVIWTISRLLFNPWSYWQQSKRVTGMIWEFRNEQVK